MVNKLYQMIKGKRLANLLWDVEIKALSLLCTNTSTISLSLLVLEGHRCMKLELGKHLHTNEDTLWKASNGNAALCVAWNEHCGTLTL